MSFFKSLTRNIDWKLWLAVCGLMCAGSLSLLSARPDLFYTQLQWIMLGFVGAGTLMMLDVRSFFSHGFASRTMYGISTALLLLTLVFAPQVKGNRAWIFIGSFQFQPAELIKLALVCVLAVFFAKEHIRIGRWKTIITSFLYAVIPACIIAIQPDMGSALVVIGIWFGFVLLSGIPFKKVLIACVLGLLVLAVLWVTFLQPYQKSRILGMFDSQQDPLGANYNVIQSKIALGAGGWFGSGFGQGVQTQLGFLPEAHTDFIFAAIVEEGGVFAGCIVLGLFLWMIARLLRMGQFMEGNTARFLCLGSAVLFLIQFVLNIGSVTGMLPVIGVTLPFVSYGGSSMLVNIILIGLVQSFYRKR